MAGIISGKSALLWLHADQLAPWNWRWPSTSLEIQFASASSGRLGRVTGGHQTTHGQACQSMCYPNKMKNTYIDSEGTERRLGPLRDIPTILDGKGSHSEVARVSFPSIREPTNCEEPGTDLCGVR